MLKQLMDSFVPPAVHAIELVGVAIILAGAAVTLVQLLLVIGRREHSHEAVAGLRSTLGRAILLGLEFLVAADIMQTVLVELTLENVASLAGIVIIRTLLNLSLETEIEGEWPWRRGSRRAEAPGQ